MKRGEIYYITKGLSQTTGSEVEAGRPAIIVSNDKCNEFSPVVEVVYLTTQPKKDLPTHVSIRSTGKQSTALCEQICSISADRIAEKNGECTEQEMQMIDAALQISLGLNSPPLQREAIGEAQLEKTAEDNLNLRTQIARIEAERETYRALYQNLLERLFG